METSGASMSAAEARRQKILARGKARLTQITGSYSTTAPTGSEVATSAAVTSDAPSSQLPSAPLTHTTPNIPATHLSAPSVIETTTPTPLISPPSSTQPSVITTPSPSLPPEAKPTLTSQPALPTPAVRSQPKPKAHTPSIQPEPLPPSFPDPFATDVDTITDAASSLPLPASTWRIGAATRVSLPFRCIAAVLLAWASHSHHLPTQLSVVPPLVLLLTTQVCLLAAGLGMRAPELQGAASGQFIGSWKYRNFDVMDAIPGLKPLLCMAADVWALFTSLADICALYAFVLVLLAMLDGGRHRPQHPVGGMP